MKMSIKKVVQIAEEMGKTVVEVSPIRDECDGEVTLGGGFSIQVGEDYLAINQELPGDIFMMGAEITTTSELKKELSKIA